MYKNKPPTALDLLKVSGNLEKYRKSQNIRYSKNCYCIHEIRRIPGGTILFQAH